MIRVGTSGFSYFYRLPDAKTLSRMADKTPPGFLLALKAFQGLTHERGT